MDSWYIDWAKRIDADTATYDAMREKLEADCFGKYVVFHEAQLIGTYDSSRDAFSYGFHKFGAGKFLMRQVGAPTDKILKQEIIEYSASDVESGPKMTMKRKAKTEPLDVENAAYAKARDRLEAECLGKWVLFYGPDRIGTYDSFEDATADAFRRFDRGPYLIREVGEPDIKTRFYQRTVFIDAKN